MGTLPAKSSVGSKRADNSIFYQKLPGQFMQKTAMGRGRIMGPPLHQIFRVMRLTAILLTCALIQVHAAGKAQSVSLSGTDLPLKIVFQAIEKQTGYVVFVNKSYLEGARPVTLSVHQMPLANFLDLSLKDQPVGYVIKDKTIILTRKPTVGTDKPAVVVREEVLPVPPPITGRVLNADGQPLEGASVRIKGTQKGVSTDAAGRFSIEAQKGEVLLISFTGFEERQYTVGDELSFTLVLKPSESKLDEVKVIAYGTNSIRTSTGNATTIKGSVIERQPVGNPLQAIQGRVAGMFIQQVSGAPGATINIKIQGTSSLKAGGEPFYVVDGVPYPSALLNTSGNGDAMWGFKNQTLAKEGSGSPLSYINPSDIESITVLKDADATAIYGSKAANGAILITTKRGKPGVLAVDASFTSGWEKMPKRIDLLNAQQYLEMRREGIRNANATVGAADRDLDGTWDTTRNTDWQETFLGKSSSYINGHVQVSGGPANANFLLGLTYNERKGMLSGNFSDKRMAVRFSANTSSANQRFKLEFGLNYMVDDNRLPGSNITSALLYMPPVAPALYNPDGSLNWALNSNGYSTWPNGENPMASLLNTFSAHVNNLLSNLTLGYNLAPGLEIRTSAGYTYLQMDQVSTFPLTAVQPADRPYSPRRSQFVFNYMKTYVVEPQLSYRRSIGGGRFDWLLAGTIQKNIRSGRGVDAQGQVSDKQLENMSAATSLTALPDQYSNYRSAALFSRLSYNYENRYMLNLTVRRDGSSRFGPRNRYANFGAIGTAWALSEEKFMKLPAFVSFLKLKTSYGITGNDQVGEYTYMNLYAPVSLGVAYGGNGSLQIAGLSNNELQWEINKKWNTGVDLGLVNDRVFVGVNYAVNNSTNLLQNFILPYTSGYGSVWRNFDAKVRNTSLEITMDVTAVKKPNFTWSIGANITRGRNKLVSLPEGDKIVGGRYNGYKIGEPLAIFYAYRFKGVDPQTGEFLVEDAQGNPTTKPDQASQKVLMDLTRPYDGGVHNSIKYKGIQLDFFFQVVKQRAMRYYQSLDRPGVYPFNQPAFVWDRWQKPGDIATGQKFSSEGITNLLGQSDEAYEDASFLRLNNVSFSWALPGEWLSRIKAKSCLLTLTTQNLLTITNYSGLDPETGNGALQPFRTIVCGFHIGF